ncbi:hypothetical protein OG455_05015 [Kitasatospora sp. NBC_01287]|uniref:hypothetical protein n=1 Tax=Kitasatospora sp. NBC_01287 TaxID=2903573 RepID=UPI0022584861|nr:hypothetical protein [Kitasatospora sp. NBC_01287]MCX4744887.1 hypothetical protein [Kitasatospora sp. NBC_01287]
MPATEQRAFGAQRTLTSHDDPEGEDLTAAGADFAPGADPGDAETWEIFRVHCPECHRPIALVGDEELLPQHAVLRTAWHPFSPALCPGSGLPTEDLEEFATDSGPANDRESDAADGPALHPLDALLTLPAELDWRTQPFSHVGGPGSVPLLLAERVPAQRGLVRG